MIDWRPRVLASGLLFPEGPVSLGDGRVAFTEVRGGCVSVWDGRRHHVVAKTAGGPNGATLGDDGALYVANNGGLAVDHEGYWRAPEQLHGCIQRVTLDGAVEDVLGRLPGDPPHRPNDLCFGPDGALYFTDPRNWDDLADLAPGRIFRADVDAGTCEQVAEVSNFCNGLAFGPDPTKLYVAQSIGMSIVELTVGTWGTREHCRLPAGFPDGFCFAADGTLIVCGSMGHVIQVFAPDGSLVQTIETGDRTEPTNCCLGDGVLYVTFSGTGELVGCDVSLEPLSLYPR